MEWIRPAELDERLDRGESVFILDIRPESEYERYHIDGSLNAPVYHELDAEGTALEPYLEDIPKDSSVVTVCRVGQVAKHATNSLEDRGFEAVTLAGGIRAWKGYDDDALWYRLKMFFHRLLS